MKKYAVAGLAALVVFAISAFAARLNVDGGVLQSGVDHDLTCADNAEVTYDHHASYELGGGYDDAWVEDFYITFDSADCIGETLWFTVKSHESSVGGGVVKEIDAQMVTIPVTGSHANVPSSVDSVSIDDIGSVSVTVWSENTPGNPGQCVGASGYGWASGIFAGHSDSGPC